ncbi:polysaccharide deacetylase family sporulation protein PdaB [Anaerobacterium chartisolvens]|uniref:Polysaccharide deacetylase family sporulation protein PdaB n=1 Tax=Anaerobacterium chartisolvens TaxID=1297424 RepID=A0A369AP71_9FIRM|nr:polysaccharide deacetylase family protein [Anaerobacterium chartisolvens]RCX11162.1 polysaccharide deacetylase family sporulation protein PdaB [Anaerobacterium chartisolvens]
MRICIIDVITLRRLIILSVITIALLLTGAVIVTKMRDGAIPVLSQSRQLPIYSVEAHEKVAAITFDCAWGAGDIPDILSTLKKEDIKSSFFIVGQWAEKFPDAVKSISDEGHDVSNHSYSHLRMGAIGSDKIRSEISICGQKLSDLSGKKVDLFRAPYGDYNNNVVSIAKDLGYYTIQWNVDSLDWRPGISENEIMDRITKKISPGSIILFHNDTPHTAKILPGIIKALQQQGYSFMPVSKMIMRENYEIDAEGMQRSIK